MGQATAIVTNAIIAFAYLGIGLYLVPSFVFDGPEDWGWRVRGARLARLSGLVFFITCAMTHIELVLHAADSSEVALQLHDGRWIDSWHGLLIHAVQAVAGMAFLVLGIFFLTIRVTTKVRQ